MILFALLALPLTMLIRIQAPEAQVPADTDRRWPLYNALLWFVPAILLAGLVLPAPERTFDFWLQLWDITIREGVLLMALPFMVAAFSPSFKRRKILAAEVFWFLGPLWSLMAIQQFVGRFQSLDAETLFLVPLVLSLMFLPSLLVMEAFVRERGRWYAAAILLAVVQVLGVLVRLAWTFRLPVLFVISLLVLGALAVLSQVPAGKAFADAFGRLPPWRPRFLMLLPERTARLARRVLARVRALLAGWKAARANKKAGAQKTEEKK